MPVEVVTSSNRLSLDVLEHDVGHQVGVGRLAGAQVNVEEAVVVDVAEIGAHDQQDPVEAGLLGHVAETGRALVVVEPGPLAAGRLAELAADRPRRASRESR